MGEEEKLFLSPSSPPHCSILDTQFGQQPLGDIAIGKRRLDAHRPAIGNDRAAIDVKFVAFGVPAEIIVIVQDQDFGGRIALAPEPRRGQPADARSDDDQVIQPLLNRNSYISCMVITWYLHGLCMVFAWYYRFVRFDQLLCLRTAVCHNFVLHGHQALRRHHLVYSMTWYGMTWYGMVRY